MTPDTGAPGDGIGRREFLAATGTVGTVAAAGCTALSEPDVQEVDAGSGRQQLGSDLPTMDPPEVVDLDEQGNQVTLKAEAAAHEAHPLENMGAPIRLPQVWAWQADDGPASVPGPIFRATEGSTVEVTLENTMSMPYTIHFHGAQTAWKDDGVPTTTGITVDPGASHTYEIPANTPATHIYHCHYQTPWHVEMGMYGILRVDPEGYELADKE